MTQTKPKPAKAPADANRVPNGTAPADSQRDRIRLAAVHLFTRQSYAGTSMKQLAHELGMVPANLYNYYPKKEAILFDVLNRELLDLLERNTTTASEVADPVRRIRTYAYDLVIEDLRNPMAAFVAYQGVNGLGKTNRDQISKLMGRVRECWMSTVREGVAQGVFSTTDVKLATLTILTLCSSMSSWYNPRGEYANEAVAGHAADATLRILGYTGPALASPATPAASRSRKNASTAKTGRQRAKSA